MPGELDKQAPVIPSPPKARTGMIARCPLILIVRLETQNIVGQGTRIFVRDKSTTEFMYPYKSTTEFMYPYSLTGKLSL